MLVRPYNYYVDVLAMPAHGKSNVATREWPQRRAKRKQDGHHDTVLLGTYEEPRLERDVYPGNQTVRL